MASRLFWKLFLTFAVIHLMVIAGTTWLATRPTSPPQLRLVSEQPAAPQSTAELTPPRGGQPLRFAIAADGVYRFELHRTLDSARPTASEAAPRLSHAVLAPGDYRLEVSAPPRQPDSIGMFAATMLLGLLGATTWLVSDIVGPVKKLRQSADRMATGHYDAPIYVANRDELGQLAATFNSMRQKMGSSLAKIRDTNQRMATVLGGMRDGVIAIDEKQQVLFANRAAGEMLGFSPSAAQGRTLLETFRSHTVHDLVVALLSSRGHREVEIKWGEDHVQSFLVSATSFSGKPSAGIVMMIHDLTDERRLESMRRDFVANVSHELKTPLSSIKAYAETLSQGAIDDVKNRRRFVRQIEQQADRLHQLISDLLSLARIEQGEERVEVMTIPVGGVVDLCVREQQRAADEKQIQLAVEAGEEDVRVEANEDGLRQMLINLIDNAIKYTPPKGRVTIGWRRERGQVAIAVSDTGIGIAADLQPRVFERFFRVDKARSREVGGTGLGLAIVKHLAQSYGGTVEVQSELEKGSRFTIRLQEAAMVAEP